LSVDAQGNRSPSGLGEESLEKAIVNPFARLSYKTLADVLVASIFAGGSVIDRALPRDR